MCITIMNVLLYEIISIRQEIVYIAPRKIEKTKRHEQIKLKHNHVMNLISISIMSGQINILENTSIVFFILL